MFLSTKCANGQMELHVNAKGHSSIYRSIETLYFFVCLQM